MALFDKDDGRVEVAACRVRPQVFLGVDPSFLGLLLVGEVSDPQENLCVRKYEATEDSPIKKSKPKHSVDSKLKLFAVLLRVLI